MIQFDFVAGATRPHYIVRVLWFGECLCLEIFRGLVTNVMQDDQVIAYAFGV